MTSSRLRYFLGPGYRLTPALVTNIKNDSLQLQFVLGALLLTHSCFSYKYQEWLTPASVRFWDPATDSLLLWTGLFQACCQALVGGTKTKQRVGGTYKYCTVLLSVNFSTFHPQHAYNGFPARACISTSAKSLPQVPQVLSTQIFALNNNNWYLKTHTHKNTLRGTS